MYISLWENYRGHPDNISFMHKLLDWYVTIHILQCGYMNKHIVNWEPEGHYRFSKMFCWKPERHYCCTKSMVIAPFWFSMEHHWTALMPFWLSTDDMICTLYKDQGFRNFNKPFLINYFLILLQLIFLVEYVCFIWNSWWNREDKNLNNVSYHIQMASLCARSIITPV